MVSYINNDHQFILKQNLLKGNGWTEVNYAIHTYEKNWEITLKGKHDLFGNV